MQHKDTYHDKDTMFYTERSASCFRRQLWGKSLPPSDSRWHWRRRWETVGQGSMGGACSPRGSSGRLRVLFCLGFLSIGLITSLFLGPHTIKTYPSVFDAGLLTPKAPTKRRDLAFFAVLDASSHQRLIRDLTAAVMGVDFRFITGVGDV